MLIDPRTPVIVGVGQVSKSADGPGYPRMSSVELAAAAARCALEDTAAESPVSQDRLDRPSGATTGDARIAVLVGRLYADGSRFRATMLAEKLGAADDPIGRDIFLAGGYCSTDDDR
ncbi:hypothetical protein [Nocardia pseudovaccinii]|uniref:hypothetical protein n=1 Tax=Nocardia pseudovaccinii TaxID=189540 RepID=UPI0007A46371|nr:hypothetical protein [Nocardia pseudovaccinii]